MGSAEISKNKTRILRYFGDLAKSLPLKINFQQRKLILCLFYTLV